MCFVNVSFKNLLRECVCVRDKFKRMGNRFYRIWIFVLALISVKAMYDFPSPVFWVKLPVFILLFLGFAALDARLSKK